MIQFMTYNLRKIFVFKISVLIEYIFKDVIFYIFLYKMLLEILIFQEFLIKQYIYIFGINNFSLDIFYRYYIL